MHVPTIAIPSIMRSNVFFVCVRVCVQELNEGVQWRLTVPEMDLQRERQGPRLHHLLGIKFELQYCEFSESGDIASQAVQIPADPQFAAVATQRLMIQRLASGLHQFYLVQ